MKLFKKEKLLWLPLNPVCNHQKKNEKSFQVYNLIEKNILTLFKAFKTIKLKKIHFR